MKTVPIQQWTVGREYRRRLKKAFDACGIEIPFPQRSLSMGSAGRPLDILLRQNAAANGNPGGGSGPGRATTCRGDDSLS